MDSATFGTDVLPALLECRKYVERASTLRSGRNTVILVETEGMFEDIVYAFHKVVRKLPPSKGLDLILQSHGGSIDAASSIASLCRERFNDFAVIVPFKAKSAATLLVLSAGERILACSSQLGPVDPQVRHPEKGMWFPAHSIKEALERVEATKDPYVKTAMADKLDPFLIGAYQDAISASKQYVEEVVQGWGTENGEAIVSVFTDKYKSHGYPIDRRILEGLRVPYAAAEEAFEEAVCELHERCADLIAATDEPGSIILTFDEYACRLAGFVTSGRFADAALHAPSGGIDSAGLQASAEPGGVPPELSKA